MPKLSEIDQKPPEYLKAVNDFVRNPRGFFLISGTNGNGKTFTARAIFDRFWRLGSDNQFWKQADLKMKWNDLFAEYKTANYLLDQVVMAPLLVLDDVGHTRPTDAFLEFLYIIADKRFDCKNTCGTIITTNLNSKSMCEMLGTAFVSRVASGICVRHDGPDRRPLKF